MSLFPLFGSALVALIVGIAISSGVSAAFSKVPLLSAFSASVASRIPHGVSMDNLPQQAQLMLPASWAAMETVPVPGVADFRTNFVPPGMTLETLSERPFHVYHEDFLAILGSDPTLTLIADSGTDPVFHEANVWYPPTDEMFFVQSSGNPLTGTGLHKSAIIQKVSVKQAMGFSEQRNAVGDVDVIKVDSMPQVINPNGATNFNGDIIFTGEGMGEKIAPTLFAMNPLPPYNTTVLLNNYFGRQFNSLNDVAVNPRNRHIYFTDVTYGERQDFRPQPTLPNQVYRMNPETMAVSVVADGFSMCNGIGFSPDGQYAYITDTGASQGFYGSDGSRPATIYRYTVAKDGTFENRKVFSHLSRGVPDGVSCDSEGNVYTGTGDGVHVWNPSGELLGKIFTGEVSPNFQFAGTGRMIICAETHLWYVGLAAKGAPIT